MKTEAFAGALLDLYFTNVDTGFDNLGDATGIVKSTADGSLYLSLHTAYPGEAGVQNTSESAYTSYARKAVARTTASWTRTGETVVNDNSEAFPAATGGPETVYFVGIGRQSAGATELDYIAPMGVEQGEATFTTADVATLPAHTLSNDDRAAVFELPKVALPTGLTAGTIYWVVGVSGNTFQLSTTQGGGAVDITVAGAALVYKMVGLAISNGITPTISAGQLSVREE
jgi:hypothetical protein